MQAEYDASHPIGTLGLGLLGAW